MPSYTTLALSSLVATAAARTCQLGPADVVSDNPVGAQAYAYLPNLVDNPIRGSVVASTAPGGVGVNFAVNFANLPDGKQPFIYHIHDQPVPADGNCTDTLAHLDPFICGEDPKCDPSDPADCQVGDLAGKHGSIPGLSFVASYTDDYASLKQGLGSFLGNRSIVIHDKDGNRLTCANFAMSSYGYNSGSTGGYNPYGGGSASPTGGSGSNSTGPSPTWYPHKPTGLPPAPTGAASSNFVSTGAAALALLAALF